MANHKSAAKRARQTIKRRERNMSKRSRVQTASRKVREASDVKTGETLLSEAFSEIQKSPLHKNTVKRKMARLAKAVERLKKAS